MYGAGELKVIPNLERLRQDGKVREMQMWSSNFSKVTI